MSYSSLSNVSERKERRLHLKFSTPPVLVSGLGSELHHRSYLSLLIIGAHGYLVLLMWCMRLYINEQLG